jgi:DNA-binding SARP family transcriptional activator/predicted ATPase
MPVLSVNLLGPFTVTKDNHPVAFAYEKVRALLAYLCTESERSHSRAFLAGLLWPDQPQSAAQDSLRQALSRLRSAIDDRATNLPYLLVERDMIQLNPNSEVVADLSIFQEILESTSTHSHRSLLTCAYCASQLEKAAILLRGRFLEDLALPDSDLFETWATARRERVAVQTMDVLGTLAAFYERAGDKGKMLAYASRQIEIDLYHESAHRMVMRALVDSGQRSQAVLHFNRLKQLLVDELGIEPAPETLVLFENIRTGHDLPGPAATKVYGLSSPLTPLVGRTVELHELMIWLADPARRLISIVGPGGAGKSRLAIESVHSAASMFTDGAIFLSLSSSTTGAGSDLSDAVAEAVLQSLGLYAGVKVSWTQAIAALHGRETLLVIDGFERAMAERKHITHLLEALPGLVILITTHQRLGLAGEWIFGLGGLDTPPPTMIHNLEAYSSAALFEQCARQVNQAFEINDNNRTCVGEICRLVGGLPLALHLAAAWTRSLTCQEIAAEIRHSLDFLSTQDGDSSIRAVFEQSWNRLSEEERTIFPRLTVFRGGFDRSAAEAVAGARVETLTRLVDKSLLRVISEGHYGLHDLLLQFGDEKLQAHGEAETMRQRHFECFYKQAEKNEQIFSSADPLPAFMWVIRESANLREALNWADSRDPVRAKKLAGWMHPDLHRMGLHRLKEFGQWSE